MNKALHTTAADMMWAQEMLEARDCGIAMRREESSITCTRAASLQPQ